MTKTSPLTLIHFHPFHTKSSIFIHLYSYLTIHPSLSLFIIFYPFSLTMSVTTSATLSSLMSTTPNITANIISISIGNSQSHIMKVHHHVQYRGERERLFGSREREGKLKITFPFYGKGTGIRKLLREGKGNLRLVIPGITGNGNSRSPLLWIGRLHFSVSTHSSFDHNLMIFPFSIGYHVG